MQSIDRSNKNPKLVLNIVKSNLRVFITLQLEQWTNELQNVHDMVT